MDTDSNTAEVLKQAAQQLETVVSFKTPATPVRRGGAFGTSTSSYKLPSTASNSTHSSKQSSPARSSTLAKLQGRPGFNIEYFSVIWSHQGQQGKTSFSTIVKPYCVSFGGYGCETVHQQVEMTQQIYGWSTLAKVQGRPGFSIKYFSVIGSHQGQQRKKRVVIWRIWLWNCTSTIWNGSSDLWMITLNVS
jgi:hypothetical protein